MNAKSFSIPWAVMALAALPLWADTAGQGSEAVETPLFADDESALAAIDSWIEVAPESPRVWVDVNAGTLGAGASVAVQLNPQVRLRLRGAVLSYDQRELWSDMDSQMKIHGNNIGLLVDMFPGEDRNFYISAGLNFGENKMRCQARANRAPGMATNIDFGGTEYRLLSGTQGEINGKYAWNHATPYIGIGYQDSLWEGSSLYYSVDLGINFLGSGNLSVGSTGQWQYKDPATNQWKDATSDQFRQSILREGRDFFKIADDLCVYPVLQLSIGSRF